MERHKARAGFAVSLTSKRNPNRHDAVGYLHKLLRNFDEDAYHDVKARRKPLQSMLSNVFFFQLFVLQTHRCKGTLATANAEKLPWIKEEIRGGCAMQRVSTVSTK